jgi:hypothetical protein
MNEFEKLNTLMDTFKTPEEINEAVKGLTTAELKRFIHILGGIK